MAKKDKVYTEQQQLFLDALEPTQGDVRKAMTIAGYSGNTPTRYIINLLHEEIVEMANKLLAANAMKAALGLVDVLENPETLGNAHKINSAAQILDRGGVIKKSGDDIKVDNGGGILILPAKKMTITVSDE